MEFGSQSEGLSIFWAPGCDHWGAILSIWQSGGFFFQGQNSQTVDTFNVSISHFIQDMFNL